MTVRADEPAIETAISHSSYADDLVAFRADFRRYLHELDVAEQWRAAAHDNTEDAMAADAAMLARLHRDGWSRVGWPEASGGLGGNELHRAVYYEELSRAALPVPAQHWTLETLGPALQRYAPDLAQRYLPAYLCGAEWWGQCFSEPEAGSDLACLRTRATRADDGAFVVNGHKIWTSQGPTATRLLALVRTGALEHRHRALTMLMIDADTPGVTVRPIALASGRRELAEVFFDNVRVGADRLVGEVDSGWTVAMYLMQFERGMYGYAVLTRLLAELDRLRDVVAASETAQRDSFARVYLDVVAAQARSATTVRKLAEGQQLGPDSSVDKLLFSGAEQRVHDLILEVGKDMLMACTASDSTLEANAARAAWWYSRAATIMGGTAEIQRGIVADHLLGLPREHR